MNTSSEFVSAMLYRTVSEVLEIGAPRPSDNFIELGGNSLMATILANRIEEESGIRPDLQDVFNLELSEIATKLHAAVSGDAAK
jgi:acyl carrier protein